MCERCDFSRVNAPFSFDGFNVITPRLAYAPSAKIFCCGMTVGNAIPRAICKEALAHRTSHSQAHHDLWQGA